MRWSLDPRSIILSVGKSIRTTIFIRIPSDGKHASAPPAKDMLLKACERRLPAYRIRPSRTTSRSDPILPCIMPPPKRTPPPPPPPPKRRFRSTVPPLRLPVLWPRWTLLLPRQQQQQQHLQLWASFLSFLLLSVDNAQREAIDALSVLADKNRGDRSVKERSKKVGLCRFGFGPVVIHTFV